MNALGWRLVYLPLDFTYRFWPISCAVWLVVVLALVAGLCLYLFVLARS